MAKNEIKVIAEALFNWVIKWASFLVRISQAGVRLVSDIFSNCQCGGLCFERKIAWVQNAVYHASISAKVCICIINRLQ